MTLICARCSQEKYAYHSPDPPHEGLPLPPPLAGVSCEGYLPEHPCLNCGRDCIEHEPEAPHPRIIGDVTVCEAVDTGGRESTFEGGGGSSGGGGASGGW